MMTWEWPDAEVRRIIDGDTLVMYVTKAIGFGGTASYEVRLRLNRINTPSLKTANGHAALSYLEGLLPIGSKVNLKTMNPYKFGGPDTSPGEWMAEITVPTGNVSDLMVAAGFAVYWNGQGPRPADG